MASNPHPLNRAERAALRLLRELVRDQQRARAENKSTLKQSAVPGRA